MTTATKKLNAIEADEQREFTEWRPLSKTQLYRTRVQVTRQWNEGWSGGRLMTTNYDVTLLEYRIAEEVNRWLGKSEPDLEDLEDLVGTIRHTGVSYSFAVPEGQDAHNILDLVVSELGSVLPRSWIYRDVCINHGKTGTRIVVQKGRD